MHTSQIYTQYCVYSLVLINLKMERTIILIILLGISSLIFGQSNSNIVVISIGDDITIPDSDLIKEIHIQRKLINKSLATLTEQALDSTIFYGGNCLQVTYYDTRGRTNITNGYYPDYFRANIFKIDSAKLSEIKRITQNNQKVKDSLILNRETSKDFEILVGLQLSSYYLKNNAGFIEKGGQGGYGNCFFYFNRVINSKLDDKLNIRLGVGAAREYLFFYPLVTLKETNIANTDSIRIGLVKNWEYQFLVPVSISYEFPNLIKKGYGLNFTLGIENRFRIHRIRTTSQLVANYNFEENHGENYEDKHLTQKANDLYSNFINPFSIQINAGIGLMTPELDSGGIRLTNMIVPSFGNGQKMNNQFGLMFFVNIPLFDKRNNKTDENKRLGAMGADPVY